MIIVEGAVIIPLFLMFMLTFLFVSNVFMAQSKIQTAAAQTASEIAEYGYLYYLPIVKSSSGIIDSTIALYNKLSHFPTHYDDGTIDDYMKDATDKINSNSDLEKIYDAIAFSPPAIIATTIVGKQKWTGNSDQILDATIAKVLLKKHLVESGKTDDVNNSLKALGVVDGLDGVDFNGTHIYKNEPNPISFTHDWVLNVNKFSITHGYTPHEVKKKITDHSYSGDDPSYIGITRAQIEANDSRVDSNYDAGKYYSWSAKSTLKGACAFYRSKGHDMTFSTYYDGQDSGGSVYRETCSDAGTDIPQRTGRNWARHLVTIKMSYEVSPLSWFGNWKFPISHQIVTEAWVPPSARVEEDKETSSTYNPNNPTAPAENSPTPINPLLVNCKSNYKIGHGYEPASCGGL